MAADQTQDEIWFEGSSQEHYAPTWLGLAVKQASEDSFEACYSEVVFSVCALESYLYEWVRDDLLRGYKPREAADMLERYFPSATPRPIGNRWREVMAALIRDGRIPASPDLGASRAWGDFMKLVDYRNELVHAGASRIQVRVNERTDERFMGLHFVLYKLGLGWPTRTVLLVIDELHQATGTPKPDWLPPPPKIMASDDT